MSVTALDKIKEIENKAAEEIKALKQTAVSELVKSIVVAKEKLQEAKDYLGSLELEYKQLTGKDLQGNKVEARAAKGSYREFANSAELADTLRKNGGTLNRKGFNNAGYSLKSAIQLAKANPGEYEYTQTGPQGSVTLK